MALPSDAREMKTDGEVQVLLKALAKGKSQVIAAAKAGMCESTARRYQHARKLPSELKKPRTHRTREDPFASDWAWIEEEITRDPALQANTLFEILCERNPD